MDPSDDHTSPSNHPPREMQMHEGKVCQQSLQVQEDWSRKAGLTCTDLCGCSDTGEDCKNKSVHVNDEDCNDEDDDVDDDESECSDSDGDFNLNIVK